MEAVYEQFFLLKHHGGWSLSEAYSLPVGLRRWFVERLQKQFDEEATPTPVPTETAAYTPPASGDDTLSYFAKLAQED